MNEEIVQGLDNLEHEKIAAGGGTETMKLVKRVDRNFEQIIQITKSDYLAAFKTC